jgi:hypothetical protein
LMDLESHGPRSITGKGGSDATIGREESARETIDEDEENQVVVLDRGEVAKFIKGYCQT